jgi:hypothetical protein
VPIGTEAAARIAARVSSMRLPVERSMTVSAPQRSASVSFATLLLQ